VCGCVCECVRERDRELIRNILASVHEYMAFRNCGCITTII
jgi:hypothetical protein